jgi:hypothetical protein
MRIVLKVVLSALIVFSMAYDSLVISHAWGLPFSIRLQDRHTMVISPTPGIPLPAPLRDGDRIDLTRLDFETRTLLDIQYNGRTVPAGATYSIPFERDGAAFDVVVTTVSLPPTDVLRVVEVVSTLITFIVAIIGLLLIWRGRDRAAAGLVVWCLGFNVGVIFNAIPVIGWVGVGALCLSLALFLLARTGFFIMADYLVAPLLPRGLRPAFWAAFMVMLLLGAIQSIGGAVYFAATGDAELMLPRYSVFFSWIYLVPLLVLLTGYARSRVGERVRLGWVAVATLLICSAVTITNAVPIGFLYAYSISASLLTLSLFALSYALLRHRLVAVALVIDRALVYGLMTTLVVGVVAAINSVLLREALPPGASLAVQVIVPLILGIALRQVKDYLDRIVERVFFRGKYLAEKALRSFARHVEHFSDAASLLDAAVTEIRRHTRSPGVAVYSAESTGYRLLKQVGEGKFPKVLKGDDSALVAVRADRHAADLGAYPGALGEDGCLFPMMVLGTLRGVIVCRNRPGEHFGPDEKKLLTQVAREVGAAWRILRARDNETYVRLMAEGELSLKAAREKARALTVAWAGG